MDAEALLDRYETALAELTPPFAFLDLDALAFNAEAMLGQAAGMPIRVASKSIRSRPVLERVLGTGGFSGILAFTLPEALWLAQHGFDDLLVGYPSVDPGAIAELAHRAAERPDGAPRVMVDDAAQLEPLDAAAREAGSRIGVCLDLDAGWPALGGRVRIGPKRSPLRTPRQAAALAREVVARESLRLEGVMAYEGQIAGVGDEPPGKPLRGVAIRAMQRASLRELSRRLPETIGAVAEVAREAGSELRFVNAGGTGSLARSAGLRLATELSAGSGLYAPTLFDSYRSLELRPAAIFCLPVVRRPTARGATLLGGGYVASGAAGADRLPQPYLPAELRLDREEGAGEVQTPLAGAGSARLRIGDRVYLRHAKAGELCERFNSLHLLDGERVVEEVPTYRGEGKAFL